MISDAALIQIIEALAAFLAAAAALIVGHGISLWWYRRWSRPRLARGRTVLSTLIEFAEVAGPDLDALRALPRRLQIRLFVDVARSLRGARKERLSEIAEQLGLLALAEAQCKDRRWWRRLLGVRLFTLVGGGEQMAPALLADGHPVVRAQAAEWSGTHPRPDVIVQLLAMLNDPADLVRFTVKDSLLRMGGAIADPLAQFLATHAGARVEGALEVAAGLADPRFLPPAVALCRDHSPEVRARAASLVGALGGSEGVAVLSGLLADPSPRVRAAAAHALGALGHWPAVPALAALLRDPAWIVRREAGLALLELDAPGTLFLRRALLDEDRFAADMARQVLQTPQPAGTRSR